MGSKTLNYDAAAITPSLFIGSELPFEHHVFSDVQNALEIIDSGGTVLVQKEVHAFEILVRLGLSPEEALNRVRTASTVTELDDTIF